MRRPTLSVMGVIYEALGFAVRQYSTVLRVAWLPILLLLIMHVIAMQRGWLIPVDGMLTAVRLEPGYIYKFVEAAIAGKPILIALMGFAVLMQTSYMVPLIKFAATGAPPHHRSVHLSFGLTHIKYILASIVSFVAIIILARLAISLGMRWIYGTIMPWLKTEHMVFAEGSLHSVELEPAFGSVNAALEAANEFLLLLGIQTSATDTVLLVVVLVLAVYLLLRFLAFPYIVAANDGRGNPLGRALALSSGINLFILIAIIIIFSILHVVMLSLIYLALQIFFFGLGGSVGLITSFEALAPGGQASNIINGIFLVIFCGALIAIAAFMAGLQAGLGGALAYRANSVG